MKNPPKLDFNVTNENSHIPKELKKTKSEGLNQKLRNLNSLKDLPLEQRKKEASMPIYLDRYE